MGLINIWNIAVYESKTLFRSWFFRIFSILALLFLFGINTGFFGNHGGARWTTRAIAANLPYINVLFINVAQAVIAVFLASDFLKRDKKLDTTEVIYARPITNGEYVVGKTLGILVLFVALVVLALVMSLIFNLISQDVPVVWEAYIYYPLLITVPTLVFILGLSFFMMILFRSQAVTFLILLGYIGLTLAYFQDKAYGMLDYMAFNLPMVYSDFVQFADIDRILLHRLAYLTLGIGFIFATVRFLNRLPQTGRWNSLNLVAFIVFVVGGTAIGYKYFSIFQDRSQHREHYLELNNRYARNDVVDVISNDMNVIQIGHSIKVVSEIGLRNPHTQALDTLIFSLNPGFVIDSITHRSGPVNYIRTEQIVRVIPNKSIAPGRRDQLSFYYRGIPNEAVAYLDIPKKQVNELKRIQVATVNKKPGIIHDNYLLLTPELLWYPIAGVGFNLKTFLPREMDFVTFSLLVTPAKGLTAIAPGKVTHLMEQVEFIPEQDLSSFPLVIGPLEIKSMEIEGVIYNLYFKPGHDFFTAYFTHITDTLGVLIKEAKDDYELDELDLYYPFKRINLVEVPIQHHAYERPYIQTVETILPEMILIPEKGAGINTLDFERFKRAEERRDRERENQRSAREIETDQFKRFLQNTFFRSGTTTRNRGGFGGGGIGGEDLIIFQGGSNYTRNPYCVFPLYYSYVTGISSKKYPVFNSMIELYLKEGYEVSPRQGFTGGITDNERANLALKERSMVDIFAQWNTELTSSLIHQTGSFIISALKNMVGMENFDYFLYYYLEDHAFSEISFEQFASDFHDALKVDIEPYLQVINSGGEMATFLISVPDYIQTRDEIGDVYLVRFKITNSGSAKGMVDATFRIMGQGGFGSGGGMSTEQRLYEIDAGTTKEVQVVLYDRPMMMTVNTLISGNIPSSYNTFLRSATWVENAPIKEFAQLSDLPVSLTFNDEYVVDNEDESFSSVSVSKESKLKQYIDSRKKPDNGVSYGSLNEWWTPSKWTPVAHSAYYGESVRSALATRSGDGSNTATWATRLPETGFYEVYVYIPVSAMYKRPSGRDRNRGGPSEGQGQGQRNRRMGPEFADKGTDYHYTISSNEGMEEVVFPLDNPEDGWNRLGLFHFPADTVAIQLSNLTGGKRVIADAVKWVRRAE